MGKEKAKKPTNASFKNESLKKRTLSENVKNVVSIEGVNGELMHYTTKGTILLNGKDVTTQAKEEVAKRNLSYKLSKIKICIKKCSTPSLSSKMKMCDLKKKNQLLVLAI